MGQTLGNVPKTTPHEVAVSGFKPNSRVICEMRLLPPSLHYSSFVALLPQMKSAFPVFIYSHWYPLYSSSILETVEHQGGKNIFPSKLKMENKPRNPLSPILPQN